MLAVDPGSRRVGLAISDELGLTAQPIGAIPAEPRQTLARRIAEVATARGARELVVGLPVLMSGVEGEQAKAARVLGAELAQITSLPLSMVDERLTSAAAERHLLAQGMRRRRRRQAVDELAAAMILETHLARRRQGGRH